MQQFSSRQPTCSRNYQRHVQRRLYTLRHSSQVSWRDSGSYTELHCSYSKHRCQSACPKQSTASSRGEQLGGGGDFQTLRTSALALAYAPAEYCAPVWCRNSYTSKIDVALNNCMRLVSDCLTSTPVEDLPVVSGLIPPDIRRYHLVLSLAGKANEKNHTLHSAIIQHPNRGFV